MPHNPAKALFGRKRKDQMDPASGQQQERPSVSSHQIGASPSRPDPGHVAPRHPQGPRLNSEWERLERLSLSNPSSLQRPSPSSSQRPATSSPRQQPQQQQQQQQPTPSIRSGWKRVGRELPQSSAPQRTSPSAAPDRPLLPQKHPSSSSPSPPKSQTLINSEWEEIPHPSAASTSSLGSLQRVSPSASSNTSTKASQPPTSAASSSSQQWGSATSSLLSDRAATTASQGPPSHPVWCDCDDCIPDIGFDGEGEAAARRLPRVQWRRQTLGPRGKS